VLLASYKGNVCALSWNFIPPGYELREGASLVNSMPERRIIGLEEMRDLLGNKLGVDLANRTVCHMICFDILIAVGEDLGQTCCHANSP
jgi:hypothetical protein